MTEPDVEFVLFDLGGVLIELGDVAALQEMTGYLGDGDGWQQIQEPWTSRFETGQCSAGEFSTGVVATWGVDITPAQYLEILRDWPIGPYPGTSELLSEIHQVVGIGCLSNTNALHWEDQAARWPELETFDYRFLSFELGLRKPDRAIYQAVADRLPYDADRVLFLDDLAVNADAARSFGFRSEQVQGVDEVVTVLKDLAPERRDGGHSGGGPTRVEHHGFASGRGRIAFIEPRAAGPHWGRGRSVRIWA